MTRRPTREPAVLHRAPFRLDVALARNAIAETQVIIARLLGPPREPATPRASAKVRAASRANKKGRA